MRERDQDQPFTSLKLWIDYDAAALICCYDRCRCAISHFNYETPTIFLPSKTALLSTHNCESTKVSHAISANFEPLVSRLSQNAISQEGLKAIRALLLPPLGSPGRKYWIIANDGNAADFVGNQQVNTKEVDHYQSVRHRENERDRIRGMRAAETWIDNSGTPSLSFAEQRPWLERTGWEETFRKKSRHLLAALVWMGLKKISTGTSSSPAAPGVHAGDSGSSELGLDSGDEDDCETEQYTTADEEDCADDEEELDDDDDDDDDNGGSSVDCEDDMNVDLSEQHNIIERSAQQTTDVDDKGGHARSDDSVNPYEAILELLFGVCISLLAS
ncbi:hypothetical protein MGU_11693 [Metarhizium guizhouense ARSEF 977]|uniref:Uncharacterized protein n=1 Tax=Metarhizium guizhouense (strain ARSEF 977) TaxID=1276136 RepID=A0A0B4G2W3_METGA|nr:hypothetical protein MGU_11693 [Metarhizium guizhouense ARSEF 977]